MTNFQTRQLVLSDYDQVAQIFEDRFATFIEYDKAQHKNFIDIETNGFDEFKIKSVAQMQDNALTLYLNPNRPAYRMYGTFDEGTLMSFVAIRILSEKEWMLDNLRAAEAPLSKTGLKETLRFVYQTVKDLGLDTYYTQIAEYRNKKFGLLLTKLVPEYYCEYDRETVRTIPAHSLSSLDFPEGTMGHSLPLVDLVLKRMTLKNQVSPAPSSASDTVT